MAKAIKKALKKSSIHHEHRAFENNGVPFSELQNAHTRAQDDLQKLTDTKDAALSDANLLHSIINQISDLVFAKDTNGRILVGSEAMARYYGLESAQELYGKTIFDLRGEDEAHRIHNIEQEILAGGEPMVDVDEEFIDASGDEKWIQITKVPMKDGNGKIIGLIGIARDITERKHNESALEAERVLFRAMIDQVPDYLFFKDTESRFVISNRALAADLGRLPTDLIGKTDFAFHEEKFANKFYADEQQIVSTGESLINLEEMVVDFTGAEKWFSASKVPLRDAHGKIIGIVGVCRDITDRKDSEERLHFMAMHDALTHLPNRTLLVDRLEQGIKQKERTDGQLTVLFIDLDNFKIVNDSLGHDAGDTLIKAVADRLIAAVRSSDTVARLGGDEFVILLIDQDNPISDTAPIIERLRASIAEPFIIEGQKFQVTCSIGGATFPNDGTDTTTLLKNADIAMYKAKEGGRDNVVFYNSAMNN